MRSCTEVGGLCLVAVDTDETQCDGDEFGGLSDLWFAINCCGM